MLHYLKHINEELNISKMADTDFDNLLKKYVLDAMRP